MTSALKAATSDSPGELVAECTARLSHGSKTRRPDGEASESFGGHKTNKNELKLNREFADGITTAEKSKLLLFSVF